MVFRETNRRGSTRPMSLVTFVPIDILYEISFAHIDNQYETMKGKKTGLCRVPSISSSCRRSRLSPPMG